MCRTATRPSSATNTTVACGPLTCTSSRRQASSPARASFACTASNAAGYADTDHVTVITPAVSGSIEDPTRGVRLGASYLVDVVSAASVDIVSTASKRWTEVRQAGTVDARYRSHAWSLSGSGYASIEP